MAKQLAWCRKREGITSNGSDLGWQRDSGSGSCREDPADQRAEPAWKREEPAWKREDREDHRVGGGAHRR